MIAAGQGLLLLQHARRTGRRARGQKSARGEKTLYDGRWRPAPGKTLPAVPEGVKPVVRFCNPADGDVTWDDLVKGPITISNREIDDLIIAPGRWHSHL
jgi:glutamyl-tRNA synthetase